MDRLRSIQEMLVNEPEPGRPGMTVGQAQGEASKREGGYGYPSSNTFRVSDGRMAFHEIGRENEDGSVTGTVWVEVRQAVAPENPDTCGPVKRLGGFRIAPNGMVVRFAGVPSRFWTAALPSRGPVFSLA
jgi:hypothetical protein